MKFIKLCVLLVICNQSALALQENKMKSQVIYLEVTEKGFEPSTLTVKPNIPVVLKITRKTDATCATKIKFPNRKIQKDLPLNNTVTVSLGVLKKGEVRFSCSMDMLSGNILVN